MIDDRTSNLNLPKPNAANLLLDDVARLRTALDGIDTAVAGKQAALGFTPENAANKGAINGYAGLDGGGKVPSSQLPSYVDDVIEAANYASLPATGETGKIYVLLTPYTSGGVTSSQFRWTGSAYAPIVSSPGSTDAVPEGSTNLYFTSARALAAVPLATASVAGRMKPGSGLSVSGDGTVSVSGAGQTFEDVLLTVATNGQTAFTVTYTVGAIDVYLNGVKLNGGGDDFTASSGTGITLTVGASTTDTLIVRRWSTFQVANAATLGGVETLQNKTLQDPKLTLGGTNGTAGQVPVSQGAGLAPVWGTIGSELKRVARTSNTALTSANKSNFIDITSGTFTQTFDACSSLGDGWFVYIRNIGTGDITLDPNSSETIDGVASYIMYPGEVRLVVCDGTSLYSAVLNPFYLKITQSKTIYYPPGYSGLEGFAWGGGGGGGRSFGSSIGSGGGGGACTPFFADNSKLALTYSTLPYEMTVAIGSAGTGRTSTAGNGGAGGNTVINGVVTSYGGGGGGGQPSDESTAYRPGGGGGTAGAGTTGTSNSAGGIGGAPAGGHFGGGSIINGSANSGYGGGSGSSSSAGAAGISIYGGGGGASSSGTSAGTSVYGGGGGSTGQAGVAPAGGGGGASNSNGGNGARGEVWIWGVI